MSQSSEPSIDIGGISIFASDWEATPASVKALVTALMETISHLEDWVSHLEEQLNQNSQNSSRSPSKDGFGAPKATEKGKGGRKRGAQPGHPGHSRKLYPSTRSLPEHIRAPARDLCSLRRNPIGGRPGTLPASDCRTTADGAYCH